MTEQVVKCPVCGELVRIKPHLNCPVCQTPHHTECWGYSGGCAIYGCKKSLNKCVSNSITNITATNFSVLQALWAVIKRKCADEFGSLSYHSLIIGEFYTPSQQQRLKLTENEQKGYN